MSDYHHEHDPHVGHQDLSESILVHLFRQHEGTNSYTSTSKENHEHHFLVDNPHHVQTTPTTTATTLRHYNSSKHHQHYCRKGTHAHYYAHNSPESYQLCDLQDIVSQFHQWKFHFDSHPIVGGEQQHPQQQQTIENTPNNSATRIARAAAQKIMVVQPYYTIHKCNRDVPFVQTLSNIGANFKCSTLNEIQFVRQHTSAYCHTDTNATNSTLRHPDIIFANPRKLSLHIKEAYETYHVHKMTFDSIPEITRCSKVSCDIELLLQISQSDLLHDVCHHGQNTHHDHHEKEEPPIDKIMAKWRQLLSFACKKGMHVVGVCVKLDNNTIASLSSERHSSGDNSSSNNNNSSFNQMLQKAQSIFTMAYKEFGYQMTILDIGGAGFPIGEGTLCTHVSNITAAIAEAEREEDEDDDANDDDNEKDLGGGREDNGKDEQKYQEDSSNGVITTTTDTKMGTHEIVETKFEKVIHSLQDYFPPPLHHAELQTLEIIAEPAHYLVADRSALVKWWGMAKTKRPASSLYTYLIKTLIAEVEQNRQLLKSPSDKIRASYYTSLHHNNNHGSTSGTSKNQSQNNPISNSNSEPNLHHNDNTVTIGTNKTTTSLQQHAVTIQQPSLAPQA